MKFKLFDGVILSRDLGDPKIAEGTRGVVMELLPPNGVAVEFFDANDDTIDVAVIDEDFVRPRTTADLLRGAKAS